MKNLLSRIEDATHGMTIPELYNTAVTPNVRNNNNIVTRNLIFTTLVAEEVPIATHQVFVANADLRSTAYDLQLINERSINPHFAGDFSSVGSVTLHLGDLYDIWMRGGGNGTYTSRDATTRTVVFDGSATLLLENLNLPPDVKYPVDLEFSLRSGAQVPDYAFTVHLRQFRSNAQNQDVYGNVSFQINTEAGSKVSGRPGAGEPLSCW